MDAELKRRVEALRRPLELAAADNFRGVRKVQGLGHALRNACDGVIAKLETPDSVALADVLAQWRATLGTWEQLGEEQQAIEVARGMRLIARLPSSAPTGPPPRERFTAAPPRMPATPPLSSSSVPGAARPRPIVGSARPTAPTAAPPTAPAANRHPSPGPRPSSNAGPVPGPNRSPSPSPSPNPSRRPSPNASPGPNPRPTAGPDNVSAETPRTHVGAVNARASARSPSPDLSPRPSAGPDNASAERPRTHVGPATARGSAEAASASTSPDAANEDLRPSAPRSRTSVALQTQPAVLADPLAPPSTPTAAKKKAKAPKVNADAPEPVVDPLAEPTRTLPGIGPAFAERLASKGLETVEDLLWCLPRRYDDVRDARSLAEAAMLAEGVRVTFVAKVTSSRMVFARRRWAEVRVTNVDPAQGASATIRWFNVWAGIEKRMPAGSAVTLSGVVKKREGRLEFANPDVLAIDVPDPDPGAAAKAKPMPTILPRYPDVTGVPASRLRIACQTACARVGVTADDGVPASVEAAARLPSLAETLSTLHAPPPDISVEDLAALNRGDSAWQRRLAFGELFALGVAVALRRRERRADLAVACPRVGGLDRVLATALPFSLTRAQQRSIDEMWTDIARPTPMNRLLQGDVGAGKTCVAFAAALQVARAKRQTAVMAPTELLAEQHADTWRTWAKSSGLRIELLTASTPRAIRQTLLALLAAGEVDVLIGTHSLLAEAVGFHALGLVVIDEQHRFGVAQRAKLRDKGDGQGAPHLLVMTATPIPRTLALTAYGDLDISILDELPPGRIPIATKLLGGKRGEAAAYTLVAQRVAAGEQAYVVCPKVEDDEESETTWKDAASVADELAAAMPELRIGLVHGRLDSATRDDVMRRFKAREVDVLVATTVIEVGVDVPGATVMVIHDAERFGLAQLHQLRGRVGRGAAAAHCLLVTHGSVSEDGRQRLDAMEKTTDGFVIAEADLALRGPGELLGPRQAGIPRLRFGSLAQHTELLLEARGHAERILDEDPDLVRPENAGLQRAIARRFAQSVYGAESG